MKLTIGLIERTDPLPPRGWAAFGSARTRAISRLLQLGDDALRSVRCVAGNDVLCALFEGMDPVWADGVIYIGEEPSRSTAPGPERALPSRLWVPTTRKTNVPPPLMERGLEERFGAGSAPWLVAFPSGSDLGPICVLSMGKATACSREGLLAMLRKLEARSGP